MKQKKYILIGITVCISLLTGLLLAGCQGPAEEEPTKNQEESYAEPDSEEAVEVPASDVQVAENNTDGKTITVSVLGKTELIIEENRINRSKCYRFTDDETDKVLSAIKGGWEADERLYSDSTDAEKPTFYFAVRDYEENTKEVEKNNAQTDDGERLSGWMIKSPYYIYVYDHGKTYKSPMKIYLCTRRSSDKYKEIYEDEDTEDGENAYPIFYIDFVSISCPDEKEDVIYEPATLALISDGRFLLIKDQACYSLKNNIKVEVMIGNYEHLDSNYKEDRKELYAFNEQCGYDEDREWAEYDLNGDGTDDLIEQTLTYIREEDHIRVIKRIENIYACENDRMECIEWDLNEGTVYSYFTPTGVLMHTSSSYGQAFDHEYYEQYHYDRNWNKIIDRGFMIERINISQVDDYPETRESYDNWCKEHPDMTGGGVYYSVFEGEDSENRKYISREEFTKLYETKTGLRLYSELGQ